MSAPESRYAVGIEGQAWKTSAAHDIPVKGGRNREEDRVPGRMVVAMNFGLVEMVSGLKLRVGCFRLVPTRQHWRHQPRLQRSHEQSQRTAN